MWRERFRSRRASYGYSGNSSLSKSKRIARLAKFAFIGVIVLVIGLFIVIPVFSVTLPSPDQVVRRDGFATQILDRNGKSLYDIYQDQRRNPTTLDQVPLYLRQATIAIEDKNFYKHQGFDPMGFLRGIFSVFTLGHFTGGSTLTQQLVKNVLVGSDRSLFRKVKELILATQIERKYTKDQILQMYLNEAPYGGTAWGVEAASEMYFGKEVKDLNLVQSAFLAGLPQGPSIYSPYTTTGKLYINRTKDVLRRMREDNYITKDQEKSALDQIDSLSFQGAASSFQAPHFVQYVQKILEDRYGANVVEQGGLKVTTTLDLDLQNKAQEAVTEEIAKVESLHITNGAAAVLSPETGEILAMVGSKNFSATDYDGQVNVTTSLRQPGSSIKPITYVTALMKGYTPATLLMDVPTTFPGGASNPDYKPTNYDGKFRGPVQMRYALANSVNIPAVKMLAMVGIKDMLTTAYNLGITSLPPTQETLNRVGLSVTLGGGEVKLLEITGAYGAFMNGGYRIDPVAILKVEDSSGKVLEESKPQKGKRVLTAEQAFLINDMLSDNNARKDVFGLNSLLNIANVAVKTGTTNDRRDNWTIGGNANAIVGVWVGNNDNSPMTQVASGVTGASPIWRRIILSALQNRPSVKFTAPSGVISASVDVVSGYGAHDGYPSRQEFFIKGTEPGSDPVHTKLKVCKSDGKLATPADVSGGNYEEKEFFVFKEDDPTTAAGGQNKWQEGILTWLSTQSDSKYHPPTDYCGTSNPLNVNFNNPHDQSQVSSNFIVDVRADSSSSVTQIILEIDGVQKNTSSNGVLTYGANGLSDGLHTLHAVAKDSDGHQSDRTIQVSVNQPFASPTPTP